MFEFLSDPAAWASLATLTLLEVVLGIDNIIFVSILSAKLPEDQRKKAWYVGLGLAAITRLLLLTMVSWLVSLDKEKLLTVFGHDFTGRDLILLGGGIFLVYKATKEIHEKLEGDDEEEKVVKARLSFTSVIIQIILLDIIFSLDSVITAVGMTDFIGVMYAAVLIALALMIIVGRKISEFVLRHPTVKMLALSFLLMIGVSLAAEAFHTGIPKGYIYSAMAFSVFVEMLNLAMHRRRARKRAEKEPVHLRQNVVGMKLGSEENAG